MVVAPLAKIEERALALAAKFAAISPPAVRRLIEKWCIGVSQSNRRW